MEKASPSAKGSRALRSAPQAASRRARPPSSAGRWVGRNREGKLWGCEGGAEPGPTIRPGFCLPPTRPLGRGEFLNHSGREQRLGAKNPGSGNFGQRMRARGAPSQTHTHFSPGLGKSPKAAPSAGKRLGAPSAAAPPTPLSSAGLPGCFPASPPVRVQPPTPGAAACSRERASERATEPASQPASLRAAAATQLRPCGRQGARRAGTRERGGASPAAARECPVRGSGGGEGCCSWGSLTPTEGAAG